MKNILIGIICAISFSAFIYIEYFFGEISATKPLVSIFALAALVTYLLLNRYSAFVCGFLIGAMWFYWISLSFIYYESSELIPLIIISISLVYGLIFAALCYFENHFYRIISLLCISFVHPFSFNWFMPELLFVNSYFEASKITLLIFLILSSVSIYLYSKKYYKSIILIFIIAICITPFKTKNITNTNPLKIKTITTDIAQEIKWDKLELTNIVNNNLYEISKAIQEQYDMIILPETAFPFELNLYDNMINILKNASKDIIILTGAIELKDGMFYNSAYLFQDGKMEIFNKIILVPFGEKIPLPEIFVHLINKYFFDNAIDFTPKNNKDINIANIKGEKFNIAICYEATREEFYKNNPKYLIAISNNAWFNNSTESTLQKIIIRYFANKYKTIVYHSSNKSNNYTIVP